MNFDKLPVWLQQLPFGGESEEATSGNGAAGTEKNSGKSTNDVGSQENSGQSDSDTSKGSQGSETSDDDDPYAGLSSKELRRILKDTESSKEQAETARKALQDKVDENERKNLTKEQNLERDLNSANDKISTLTATNTKLAIINSILMESKYQWHNVEMVAAQLNPEIVKVGDDGKVEGLIKELARVAKDNEWMLKTSTKKQDSQGSSGTGRTGFQPGQGGANDGGANGTDVNKLAKVFPALSSRM